MTLFIISHFIQTWILPPGLNLLLAGIGFLVWQRWRGIGKIFIAISYLSLWLLSMPMVAWHLINRLQQQYPVLNVKEINKSMQHIAIVVLAGGDTLAPEYDNDATVNYISLTRLYYSAYLYRHTHFPIIVSGGKALDTWVPAADLMEKSLVENFHIPVKWKEDKSVNTADESRFLIPLLKQNNIQTIYLITNAWHMPRSMYIFEKYFKNVGLHVIAAPMGFVSMSSILPVPGSVAANFFPSLEALSISLIALHEYIGMAWYSFYY